MNDASIVRQALNIEAQERGIYENADTVMDALSQMWDGVDGPMAVLRQWGLSPAREQQFWNDFENLLDDLKNTMPGVAIGSKKESSLFSTAELQEIADSEIRKLSSVFGPYLDNYRNHAASINGEECLYEDRDVIARIAIIAGNLGWSGDDMSMYPEDCVKDVLDYLGDEHR